MRPNEEQRPIFDTVRQRLAGQSGPEYWRSLEQVAETPEFQQWMDDEFPNRSSLLQIDRRSVLKFMGASIMLAGLGGCRSLFLPSEKVVPYVKMPEDLVPGKPMFFATAAPFFGSAVGLLVESHEGRPTKIEGNPDHPGSLGSSDSFAQASVLDLYDPDRTIEVYDQGEIATWDMFLKAARTALADQKASKGAGLRVLTTPVNSPTQASLLRRLQTAYPAMRVVEYEPVGMEESRQGTEKAFGERLDPVYALDKADVVVALDADFLRTMPGSIRMARDFATRRSVPGGDTSGLNRLYAVESVPSLTGAVADHRKAVKPSLVEAYAWAIASLVGAPDADISAVPGVDAKWVGVAARDLKAHAGRSLVIPGVGASAETHALAHAINARLGNVGNTVSYVARDSFETGVGALKSLTDELNSGSVGVLVVLGGNPAFDAPADLGFGDAIQKAKFSVHHAISKNETTAACQWHTPESHFLEAWGDAQYIDGTASIAQPLIAPIYQSRSAIELLSALLDEAKTGLEIVQRRWRSAKPSGSFDKSWNEWLNTGVVPDTALPKVQPVLQGAYASSAGPAPAAASGTEIALRPDPTIWDGRYANNGWLQELPKPLTTLTWENAAMVSPKMAESMGLANGDLVSVAFRGAEVEMPAYIHVGHPEDAVTVHFGYGRTEVGNVGTATGANAYRLRRSDALWHGAGVELKKLGRQVPLGLTQTHFGMEGRGLVKSATVAEFAADPEMRTEGEKLAEKGLSMYPENQFAFDGPQWGMTIDLNLCTGCNACVTACQAENNIPVVGKEQVVRGREMHWIRIDRYYRVRNGASVRDAADRNGSSPDVLDSNSVETVFQPVACMHCEKAPCEPVCPVAATVHSHEGLNQMVYNRCVGTRYCSNNCPYKVRRFNFLNYTDNMKQFDEEPKRPLLRMLNNPDVTVRGRGVMEKCTYCVQRINDKRIEAKKAGRPIADGEVVTACQQACPSKAITFGNVADANSAVAKSKRDVRNYSLLPELNTVNRTTYLTKLRNPHPELERA